MFNPTPQAEGLQMPPTQWGPPGSLSPAHSSSVEHVVNVAL
jgi:hypothetical protein